MGVAIGVDSHKGTLAVAVLDNIGRAVGLGEFTNDARSHELLISWIAQYGSDRVIGIEGSGNYGAGLARRLLERDEDVREVPAFLSHRERRKNPSRGKSDVNDAVAIARVVARGDDLSSPRRTESFQDLKLLSDHRDQLVRTRTQLMNRTHKNLIISHPGYENRIPKLSSKKNLRAAMSLLRSDRSVRAELIRDRVAEIRRLNEKIVALEKQMAAKVKASGTSLTQLRGIRSSWPRRSLARWGIPRGSGPRDRSRCSRARLHSRPLRAGPSATDSIAEGTVSSTTRSTRWRLRVAAETEIQRRTWPGFGARASLTRKH